MNLKLNRSNDGINFFIYFIIFISQISNTLDIFVPSSWKIAIFHVHRMKPMKIDDPAYPFLAFAGIPSISFHFITSDVSTDNRTS